MYNGANFKRKANTFCVAPSRQIHSRYLATERPNRADTTIRSAWAYHALREVDLAIARAQHTR